MCIQNPFVKDCKFDANNWRLLLPWNVVKNDWWWRRRRRRPRKIWRIPCTWEACCGGQRRVFWWARGCCLKLIGKQHRFWRVEKFGWTPTIDCFNNQESAGGLERRKTKGREFCWVGVGVLVWCESACKIERATIVKAASLEKVFDTFRPFSLPWGVPRVFLLIHRPCPSPSRKNSPERYLF